MPDRILVLSVFIVASCGLAYELILGALSSYLLGDSIVQFSSIIGCYLFAMGVGSHLAQYIEDDKALERFIDIELLVGLIGGLSAAALFVVFAWAAVPFRSVLYALVFLIGTLVGMEIPLVMRILHSHKTAFNQLVSRVLTFDYMGALAVSLLFPLLLAPRLGLVRSGFLFGLCNVGIALWTTRVFRHRIAAPRLRTLKGAMIIGVLLLGFGSSDFLTAWAERGLFGDEVLHAETTRYQRLAITRWHDDLRLYINGHLQFSSRDEHRYHEALVHPLLETLPWAQSVLVLGGGDGLALREVLRYPNVRHVTLVDLDPAMTGLFSRSAPLLELNRRALLDPRVTVVNADAGQWLETPRRQFDAVIVDFPDPTNFALGKLYSVPFYRLLSHHVAERGGIAVQATSPYFAPRAFWTIEATLKAAGWHVRPYHAYVPSFGEWGFMIAGRQPGYRPPDRYRLQMRFLDGASTQVMFSFPPDMQRIPMPPNRLNTQSLVDAFERDWREVQR